MGKKSRMKQECHAGFDLQETLLPLGNGSESLDQKVLVLVTGLPYSGKTTFAKYLDNIRSYPVVEGDELDTQYANSEKGIYS